MPSYPFVCSNFSLVLPIHESVLIVVHFPARLILDSAKTVIRSARLVECMQATIF